MKEKKGFIIDMDKLIIRVHNKIALWNNADYTQLDDKSTELKILAHDIVSDIISTAFSGLESVNTRVEIVPDLKNKDKNKSEKK